MCITPNVETFLNEQRKWRRVKMSKMVGGVGLSLKNVK